MHLTTSFPFEVLLINITHSHTPCPELQTTASWGCANITMFKSVSLFGVVSILQHRFREDIRMLKSDTFNCAVVILQC